MSSYNYTKKPIFIADGKLARSAAATSIYPAPMGWVAPMAGKSQKATVSLTWTTGVVTVVCTAHGLVANRRGIMITGVTPDGYNGYHVITVVDANTFTFPLAADPGAATVQGLVSKNYEVVVGLSSLDVVNADAVVVPTYTAAVSYSGTLNMVTGNIMTVTLTASEIVATQGVPKIAVTIGANVRQMTYDFVNSTTTSLIFHYTIVAADVALAGAVVVATTINTGVVLDVLPRGKQKLSAVTFVTPATTLATAN